MPRNIIFPMRLIRLLSRAVLLLLFIASFPVFSEEHPVAKKGVIDLRNHDFWKKPEAELDGDWEFYRNRLYRDLKTAAKENRDLPVPVFLKPVSWGLQKEEHPDLTRAGFGTYRIKILFPEKRPELALYIKDYTSSIRVILPEKQTGPGKPGRNKESTEPSERAVLTALDSQGDSTTVIVEVANFHHGSYGGLLTPPVIGEREHLFEKHNRASLQQAALLSVFLIFGLYHLIINMIRRSDAALWFGIYCLLFALRTSITGNFLLIEILPSLDYGIVQRVEYAGLISFVLSGAMLLHALFPGEFPQWLRNTFAGVAVVSLAVVFLSLEVMTGFLIPIEILILCIVLAYIITGVLALIRKRQTALIFFSGFLILSAAIVADIVLSIRFGTATNFAALGMIAFVFSQAIVIAKRFARAMAVSEELSENLEQKVIDRTEELDSLAAVARKATEGKDLQGVLTAVAAQIDRRYGAKSLALFLPDHDRNFLLLRVLITGQLREDTESLPESVRKIPLTREGGTLFRTYNRARPFYLPAINRQWLEKSPCDKQLVETLNFNWFTHLPLIVEKRVEGIIAFSGPDTPDLNAKEIEFCQRLASQVAGAVRAVHLLEYAEAARNEASNAYNESERLLNNVLPEKVAEELKRTGSVKPLLYESVSVVFTDFVGFTGLSARFQPEELIKELDGCFSQFDAIAGRNRLEKLKTIGDSFMCAGGLPEPNQSHPVDACLAALEMREFIFQMFVMKQAADEDYWELRIGIHTGPVTAGVIGTRRFAYDIWGHTVNTASRMESFGVPGEINISEQTYSCVKHLFECEPRGMTEVKGIGQLQMYILNRVRPEYSKDEAGLVPNDAFFTSAGLS